MQMTELILGSDLQELISHGTLLFPCAGYDEDFDKFVTGDVPWHWHEEIELVVVYRGKSLVQCGADSFTLGENDGIFINSNVLHYLKPIGDENCRIISLLFRPSLIAGSPQSIFEQKYVSPITSCRCITGIQLSSAVPWQNEALEAITQAYRAYEGGAFGYELLVREGLTHMWRQLALNTREVLLETRRDDYDEELRVKKMLTFMQKNYARQLDVRRIAAAANVSESECYRCFKKIIHYSPFDYLLRYRVSAAAGLLGGSDKPITEIGFLTGFNSPSHFSKMFGQFFGCTPREYRRRQAEEAETAGYV